ncbi:hypothetical protein B0H13DRAFT_1877788 [Mycena leptocephala]|nr:hypothetical protein B0H13DRAFT_1877788 [Mycena leptocephala]
MDHCTPYTARPAAGASWFSLARLVVLLQGLMPLFWFLEWFSLDGMDWDLAGFGFEFEFGIWIWLNGLLWWIQKLEGKSMEEFIIWTAACVYFAESPDLARAGLLVVCGVVGWITIFTRAPYLRVSRSRKGRIRGKSVSRKRGSGGLEVAPIVVAASSSIAKSSEPK